MANRVWVVSELYYPEESATGHYMTGIAQFLAKEFDVHAVCAQPNYLARGMRVPSFEIHNGVKIHRVPSTSFHKDSMVGRLLNIITTSLATFSFLLLHIKSGDIIIVVTNPPTLPYMAFVTTFLSKAKLILRIDDVYPNVLRASGIIQENTLIYKLIDYMTRAVYRYACSIVVLGLDMKDLVSQKLFCNHAKIHVITNWSDSDTIRPVNRDTNILLNKLRLNRKFIVQCAGNFGRVQGVEFLILAAESLKHIPDIHFLFIGSGAKKEWMVDEIKRKQLENVTVLPNQPRSSQIIFLNASDLCLSTLIPEMIGVSVPSRVYNILAAGKPLLAVVDHQSEIGKLVTQESIGWVVSPTEPHKISNAILKAFNDRDCLAQMGRRARHIAENKYSQSVILESYLKVINEVHCLPA